VTSDPSDQVRPGRAAGAASSSTEAETEAESASRRMVGGRDLPVAIGVGVALGAAFLGSIFWDPLAFTVVVAVFVVVAVIESAAELRRIGMDTAVPAMVLGGVVSVFGAYRSQHAGQVAGLLVLFLGAILWLLADPDRRDVVSNLTMTVLLGVWTGFLGSFGVLLVNRPEDGPVAVLAVIGAAVFGDIGGYAVGVRFGRTKIAPSVSPNKSLEGLVGGVVVAGGLAAVVLPAVGDLFTPLTATVVAVLSVLAGFLGDLAESMVKRDLGVKDFGNLLPGHGGILDRVDGILMAMPVGFFAIAVLT
jgi:phosphatidate cytidylyltransferase